MAKVAKSISPVLMTIAELAVAVDESLQTMRYLQQLGMPCARPGGKGRGHAALYDLGVVQAWLADRELTFPSAGKSDGNKPAQVAQVSADPDAFAQAWEFDRILALALYAPWVVRTDPGKDRDACNIVMAFMAGSQRMRQIHGLPPISAADIPDSIKQMQRRCRT